MHPIFHTIKAGDTLYLLAKHYHTTVDELLRLNPHVDPYNLQIGKTLIICPGEMQGVMPTVPPIAPPPIHPPVKPIPPIGTVPPHPVPPIGVIPPAPPAGIMPEVPPVTPPIGVIPPRPTPPPLPIPPIGTLPPRPPIHPPNPPVAPPDRPHFCFARKHLIGKMRLVWLQHVYWTRMAIISIIDKLKDATATSNRLMQNPKDIANVFGEFYCEDITKDIEKLIHEHLAIGGQLFTSMRDKNQVQINRLNQAWYANANRMSDAFAGINTNYNAQDLKRMFYSHLDSTKLEAQLRINGRHQSEIETFNKLEKEILDMADYFSSGLIQEFFPERVKRTF